MDKEIVQAMKKLDPVKIEAVCATMRALAAGKSYREAIELGNIELIKGGRQPLDPDDVIAASKRDAGRKDFA